MNYVFKLSKASKMPCSSFSLPAQACKTGTKLAAIKGSVCHGCYALKGNYRFPAVKASRQANLDQLPIGGNWQGWIDGMIKTILKSNKSGFFRWHDSGDIQSLDHYKAIIEIADKLPMIKFWLPTKEGKIIREHTKADYDLPDNLIVRLSSPMVDQRPLKFLNTSTVHKDSKPFGFTCPAPTQGGACMDCRACWDKTVPNVSYAKH